MGRSKIFRPRTREKLGKKETKTRLGSLGKRTLEMRLKVSAWK